MKILINRYVLMAGVFLLVCTMVGVAALDSSMSRYNVIIERKPFGDVPVITNDRNNRDATQPKPPQVSFAKDWKLTVVTTGPYGVRVGLHNKNSKLNYFAYVGDECEDGVVVQDADFDKETVTLARDGYVETLGMHSMPVSTVPISTGSSNIPWSRSRSLSRSEKLKKEDDYYKQIPREEYLKKRYSQPRPKAPRGSLRGGGVDLSHLSTEEREMATRLYNMDLIRLGGEAGMPLPITLTPEEDAQLVAEGVLPPL